MAKEKTIFEIASAFDMTINELAKSTGYSRKYFYQSKIADTPRFRAAVERLASLNRSMFQAERAEAIYRFNNRVEAIEALEKLAIKGGAEDG